MMGIERNAVLVSTDTVGERIKKARVARNIKQTELSKGLERYINGSMNGKLHGKIRQINTWIKSLRHWI